VLDLMVDHRHLIEAVNELAPDRRIIGPVSRQDRYFYEEVERAEQLDLGFNYCVYSPKSFLLPASETLFTFSREAGGFEANAVFDGRPAALVGVHPCDINAIRLLDKVFRDDHCDEHYWARRENTLIVGVDCPRPCTKGVFCQDMHSNEAQKGFDVMLYPLAEGDEGSVRYGVVFGTDTGRAWLSGQRGCTPPTVSEERAFEKYRQAKRANFPATLATSYEELPALLDRSYDSLIWEATARRCYSCGSCVLTCPTCYCFSMHDELELSLTEGTRKREWDGCQLPSFAVVAGGHNFRPEAAARLRHRVFRKGKWVRERTGLGGCVGCARCDRACTAKISLAEIYNQLAEEV
jgi:formate hydrogenlyase subunit 6/NADH:ubiquinone oxidoreductase subunit I